MDLNREALEARKIGYYASTPVQAREFEIKQ